MSGFAELVAARRGVEFVRHAILTFSGTWAKPGTGYPSWVVAGAADTLEAPVFEVPVQAPWSFGFIGAPNPNAASYAKSVDIAVEWAVAWILAHPLQTFGLGGYSQGAEAASRVLLEIITPGGRLYHLRYNFIGGYSLGNPMRGQGHSGPALIDPGGRGIAAKRLPADLPATWVDIGNPGDMYTSVPAGPKLLDQQAGDNITACYMAAIQLGLDINSATAILSALTGKGGLAEQVLELLANPLNIGALAKSVAVALQFVAQNPPTGPHITYEWRPVTADGRTGIQYAVDHVGVIAAATPAAA
jgi:hypothetical protein